MPIAIATASNEAHAQAPNTTLLNVATCRPFPFTIGADPEFSMAYKGQPINANHVIEELYGHSETINRDMGKKIDGGILGYDGAGAPAELRPSPSDTPKGVADNIGKLMAEYVKATDGKLSAITNSVHASVGGHIHLKIDREYADNPQKLHPVLTRVLSMYAPLLANNSKETEMKRDGLDSSYGSLIDYRFHNPTPSVTTLELRVPSAEWLTTPKIAEATLAYVATVYNEAMFHPETFKGVLKKNLPSRMETVKDLQNIRNRNPFLFSCHTKLCKKAIKKFEFYAQYKHLIDYILDDKQVLKDKQAVNYDMVTGWNLAKTGTSTALKPVFTSPTQIIKAQKPLPKFLENYQPRHNGLILCNPNDDGVIEITQDLIKIINGSEYEPKHKVYFFGIGDSNVSEPYILRVTAKTAQRMDGTDKKLSSEIEERMTFRVRNLLLRGTNGNTKRVNDVCFAIGLPRTWRVPKVKRNVIRLLYLRLMLGIDIANKKQD